MKALTKLAVDNREILEHLQAQGSPDSVEQFARILDRDPSNLRKTLKGLEAEGWISRITGDRLKVDLTEDGARALEGMAVTAGRLKAGLPPLTHAQIQPDPNQPRKAFDAKAEGEDEGDQDPLLEQLIESIAERDVLQPLLLRLTGPTSAHIVAGERRWRAIGKLIERADPRWPADKPIPYHVSSRTDEGEILADQVVENLQRSGLTPMEEAAAFAELKRRGWGVGRISKTVSKSRRFVELRLELLDLPDDLQARLRLSKGDEQYLTPARARELATRLRHLAAGDNEQRDIEEIVPAGSVTVDELAEARQVQLEPKALLALGEIADATLRRRSTRFPNSASPVVDVDQAGALRSPSVQQLEAAKMVTVLIDMDQQPPAAGVRLELLGHTRLRMERAHPADDPRALFHLRREAGLSADQARAAERSGLYAALWLNQPGEKARARLTDQQAAKGDDDLPAPTPAEALALVELRARIARRNHYAFGGVRIFHPVPEEFSTKFNPLFFAIHDSTHGETRAYLRFTAAGDRFLEKHQLWIAGVTGPDEAIHAARMQPGAWRHRGLRLGEYATEWLSVRAAAPPPWVEPADENEGGEQQELAPILTLAELRILGDVYRAQAHELGAPVKVGKYWLDLDAVGLWKKSPEPLLSFVTAPGAGWTVSVTDAGEHALTPAYRAEIAAALDAGTLEAGPYLTSWLNAAADDAQDDAGAADDEPEAQDEQHDDEEGRAQLALERVRVTLAKAHTAGDIRELLKLVGLRRPFETIDEDWAGSVHEVGIVYDAGRQEAAVADSIGRQPHALAHARATLIAYALNLATGNELEPKAPVTPQSGALLEIHAGDVVTKGGAHEFRILERLPNEVNRGPVFRTQPVRNGKDYGKPTNIAFAEIVRFAAGTKR